MPESIIHNILFILCIAHHILEKKTFGKITKIINKSIFEPTKNKKKSNLAQAIKLQKEILLRFIHSNLLEQHLQRHTPTHTQSSFLTVVVKE